MLVEVGGAVVDGPHVGAAWWALDVIERAEDDPGLRSEDVTEVRALAWEAVALATR
ncbi:hypothetical protein [Nocardioides marmoraquaticus]